VYDARFGHDLRARGCCRIPRLCWLEVILHVIPSHASWVFTSFFAVAIVYDVTPLKAKSSEVTHYIKVVPEYMDCVEKEVMLKVLWQCQRRYPGKGWTAGLLPSDKGKWKDGDRWKSEGMKHHGYDFKEQYERTLPSHAMWVSEQWHEDDGLHEWEYAFDFPRPRNQCVWTFKSTAGMTDFVRRKKWVRKLWVPHQSQPGADNGNETGYKLAPADLLQMDESERLAILNKVKGGAMSIDDALMEGFKGKERTNIRHAMSVNDELEHIDHDRRMSQTSITSTPFYLTNQVTIDALASKHLRDHGFNQDGIFSDPNVQTAADPRIKGCTVLVGCTWGWSPACFVSKIIRDLSSSGDSALWLYCWLCSNFVDSIRNVKYLSCVLSIIPLIICTIFYVVTALQPGLSGLGCETN
jgi:hypothetical protein